MIQARLAWVHCEGLSISVWNETNLNLIFQDWGNVISTSHVPLICNMYQKKMVAINTYKVLPIDDIVKIIIHGKNYWLRIKKSLTCFDVSQLHHNASLNTSYKEIDKGKYGIVNTEMMEKSLWVQSSSSSEQEKTKFVTHPTKPIIIGDEPLQTTPSSQLHIGLGKENQILEEPELRIY